MDLDDSELYWTRKKKGLATEKETEKETEEYIRSLESKLNKEKEKNKCLRDNINHSIRTSAIKEALGLEGDITEEELLNYIDSVDNDEGQAMYKILNELLQELLEERN